jgi:hypothetical protein
MRLERCHSKLEVACRFRLTFAKLIGWLIVAIHELIGGLRLRHVLSTSQAKKRPLEGFHVFQARLLKEHEDDPANCALWSERAK